ncbi:hypothetical protein CMI37_22275 [Candidatus Pacearchaeota archaeon]|nr:hypothetical protein [Candidatus Pacearchaeota archaeon]
MNTETEENSKTNQLTTVKTIYARAVVLLLALNFCLTGYVVYNMNSTMQEQIDSVTENTLTVSNAKPLSAKDN